MRTLFKKIIAKVLRVEAALVLRRYKPQIVAITGSVGKTSTKDAIYMVVAQNTYTRKSEKSFNSEIGLPLTILGQGNAWNNPIGWIENLFDGMVLWMIPRRYPQWLVLEVGADRPGDIRSLASWLPVDIAVITRLPEVPVHVEFFESVEALKEEKASLIRAVKPGGALVLYGDDPEVARLRERAPGAQIVTFGFSESADVRATNVEILFEEGRAHWPIGMRATILTSGASAELVVRGTIGAHAILPALAAAAVGKVLAKNVEESAEALKNYEPPHGRMRLIEGLKETLIIDDTYNSSPAAVHAALEALALTRRATEDRGIPPKRLIAVLGDMLELGRHSVEEHRKAGAEAAKVVDMLITVGFRARDIAAGALDNGLADDKILQFEECDAAGKELEKLLEKNDVILIKGSQSMRMENIVEEIMLHPEQAANDLVRQDAEWKKR